MRDEAFQKDLARWRAEAESGDRLVVINQILDDISSHLSTSIVDNSARIARMAELLGMNEAGSQRDEPVRNNGNH